MVLRMAPLNVSITHGETRRLVVVSNRVPAPFVSGLCEEVRTHIAQSWSNQFLADLIDLSKMQRENIWRSVH